MKRLSKCVLFVLFFVCLEGAVLPVFGLTNYAEMPGWWEGYHYYGRFIHGVDPQIVFWDTDVMLNGSGTIRCEGPASLTNQWREVDLFANDNPFAILEVSPGDNVTFTGYCKTDPSTHGSPGGLWEGGIIGIDLFRWHGAIRRIWEVCAGESPSFSLPKNYNSYDFVNYGENWTFLNVTFTVPSKSFTTDSEGNSLGGSFVVDAMVPWVAADPRYPDAEAGAVWFGDLQLYINEAAPVSVSPTPFVPQPAVPFATVVPVFTDGSRFSAEYGVGVSGVDGGVFLLCLVICIGIFVGVFEGFRGSLSR